MRMRRQRHPAQYHGKRLAEPDYLFELVQGEWYKGRNRISGTLKTEDDAHEKLWPLEPKVFFEFARSRPWRLGGFYDDRAADVMASNRQLQLRGMTAQRTRAILAVSVRPSRGPGWDGRKPKQSRAEQSRAEQSRPPAEGQTRTGTPIDLALIPLLLTFAQQSTR